MGGRHMASIFEGIKVIDLTNNLAGPLCTQMLADYGAEVYKVERPGAGDDTRSIAPRIEGQALFYFWANRGKKSITLALDDPRAQEVLYEMTKTADIFIESYKPGMMKRFHLEYERLAQINPKLIYCSVSVAGQTGAHSDMPGFDIIAQGMSGLMDMTGEVDGPPTKCGTVLGDYVGTLNAFGAISAALFHRERTGEGQYIDISLLDGLVAINTCLDQAATLGTHPTRTGGHHNTICPYGIFRNHAGESCIIAAYTAKMWPNLCRLMGRPELTDDPKFATNVARLEHLEELVGIIEDWLDAQPSIDAAVERMAEVGIATCKIYDTSQVAADPDYWERGILTEIPLPPSFHEHTHIRARGAWLHFSKTPAVIRRASDLGEYNQEVLSQYGMTPEEIDRYEAEWAGRFQKK